MSQLRPPFDPRGPLAPYPDPRYLRSPIAGILTGTLALAMAWRAAKELEAQAFEGLCDGPPAASFCFGVAAAIVLLLLCMALRRRLLAGLAPLSILTLASLGVVVAGLSYLEVLPCPAAPETSALAVSLGVAALLFCLPGLRDRRWRILLEVHRATRVDALFVALFLALCGSGAAALRYQIDRAHTEELPSTPLDDLPPAGVQFGAEEPAVVAAYFIDVACEACRDEFREITAQLRDPELGASLQLRLYHAPSPRKACVLEGQGPAGGSDPLSAPSSLIRVDSGPCLAAVAIECVEVLAPGLGIRMAGELFDHQRRLGDPLGRAVILAAAAALGLPVDPSDPSDPSNALLRCIDGNRGVHRRVAEHIDWASERGVEETPHGFFVGVTKHRLDPARVEAFRGRLSPRIRAQKIASVSHTEAENK